MKPCVLDASAIAAALFRESGADRARAVLTSSRTLHAPDLVHAELANVIWKRFRRGDIDRDEAGELLQDLLCLPLRITPSAELVEPALQLGLATDRTVYDCLYVALAIRLGAEMLTADKRLANAMAATALAKHITLAWSVEGA